MAETKSCKMNLLNLTKNVLDRIYTLDPDNFCKIMGSILFKEPSEQQMMKLAFGPESTFVATIIEAKQILGLLSPNASVSSQNQAVLDPLLTTDQHPLPQSLGFVPQTYPDLIREDYSLCNQEFLHLEKKIDSSSFVGNHYCYQDASLSGSSFSGTSRRSPSLPEFLIKPCHYFSKGSCKHGANCRYYHGQSFSDGYSQACCSNFNEMNSEENGFSPRSLKKLEMEISDILKSHKGIPVSISLLPMLYYEKYGRSLQADGYMTESQRHGKAGFNLTKLLARLKNSICLIDRPHGQHSIILAEDAARYRECSIERSEPVGTYPVSYQIYLTFPADSTFSEHDVSNYFKQFGPVKDVRIPIQEKRMYGFASFVYPETVCDILMKKNPHYICGSRVLVKPYKDKSREAEKTFIGKNKFSMHYQYLDLAIPRKTDSSRVIKHLEEQQQMIELDRRRLACFNFAQESLNQKPCFRYGADDSKLLEDSNGSTLENNFGFMPNVLNNGLSSYVRSRNTSSNHSDKESGHIELPENPFASPPSAGGCF